MKRITFAVLAALLTLQGHAADVKISQLPLGVPGDVGANDSFPYVDVGSSTTKRLKISQLINIPAFASTGLPVNRGGTGALTATDALTNLLPDQSSASGKYLKSNGTLASWGTPVTSVGLADGSSTPIFDITNSPVTTTGTLTASLKTQTANKFLASATSGGSAQPTFRVVDPLDIPTLNQDTTGTATNATNASHVGTVAVSTNASFFPVFTASSSNGNQVPNLGTGLSFNPSTNTLTTTTFSGALSGNATTATSATSATSATTATTATNATNGTTVATSSNASFFPLFAASSSNGNQPFNLGTGLSFNPSTNTLTTTTFSGALSGNATTATTATTATNATNGATVSTSSNASFFPLFAASSSNGNQPFNLGTGLSFNPSTNALTTTTFVGALTGTASGNTAYTANNHGVVVSGSANTMTVIAPDSSTTKVLTSSGASADPIWAEPSGGGGIYASGTNLISNNVFITNTTGWTASGGTFARTTTAAEVLPPATTGAHWDSSSASQTLVFTASTVTASAGLSSVAVTASVFLRCATGTCTHKLQVYDGTNVLGESVINSSTTAFIPTSVTATAPSSGTIQLRLISVASNEPDMFIGQAFLGRADSYDTAIYSQAKFIGNAFIANTGSCRWTRTNAALGAFATTAACPGPTVDLNPGPGVIQTTDTDLPKFTVNNLPPGYFQVRMTFTQHVSISGKTMDFAINDGTDTKGSTGCADDTQDNQCTVTAWFSYTTAGSHTFELYGAAVASGQVIVLNDNGLNRTDFDIVQYPTTTDQGYRPDQLPASWSGYHSGNCSWSTTSSSLADPTGDATCTFTELTNRNFGTVASIADGTGNQPQLTFTPSRAGRYLVLVTGNLQQSTSGSNATASLTDGSNTELDTQAMTATATNNQVPMTLSGILNASSTAAQTLKVRLAANANTATLTGAGSIMRTLTWKITALDQSFPAPLLVGSVTSNSSGTERIERAQVTVSNSAAAIVSQSGTWLSVANGAGAGLTTGTMTGFTGVPACSCTVIGAASTSASWCGFTSEPSTSTLLITRTRAGAAENGDVNIICMGQR